MSIEWSERYSLGNERIDLQHQELLQLAGVAIGTQDKASYQLAVMQLYRHFRIHFADEESLMREVGYPEVNEHCSLHLAMITRLNEISEAIAQGHWDRDVISNFMDECVVVHILRDDFKVATHIRKTVGLALETQE